MGPVCLSMAWISYRLVGSRAVCVCVCVCVCVRERERERERFNLGQIGL